jgi:hypothetical protein
MIRNRVASRTLIERGEVRRGAIRRGAALLRRDIRTGRVKPPDDLTTLKYLLAERVSMAERQIEIDIASGKYRPAA